VFLVKTKLKCFLYNPGSNSAFYIGSKVTTIAANTTNIVFDYPVTTTVSSLYNINSKTVTSVLDSGVYWFQLAAGVPANTLTDTRLNGLPYPVAVVSATTNYPDDVMMTDTIQYVNTSTQLTVSNTYSVFGTKNGVMGTSLLGFRLDNIMSIQVYFSVQCIATSISVKTVITFDRVLINVGNAWSAVSNAFTAPYDGNYFFSFATGAPPGIDQISRPGSSHACIMCYSKQIVGYAFVGDGGMHKHNNYIMSRGAAMVQLKSNANVTFKTDLGAGNYGSTDGLINAQGFLYSPLGSAAAAIAWGVNNPGFYSGPGTALKFNVFNVNLQGVWNTTTNTVTIPVAGTYFIDLTTVLYGYEASRDRGNGDNGFNYIK
jgi:hypothetical protein